VLRNIVRRREGLMHVEPAGLRAAAEEALGLLENRPSSARVRAASQATEKAGLTSRATGTRPRRYLRFHVNPPLAARVVASASQQQRKPQDPVAASAAPGRGVVEGRVETLSLGGAFIVADRSFHVGDAINVEIRAGLRRIQGMAVVRNAGPNGGGVEFVHMKPDDREKLRQLIRRLSRS
jgi:hypothetical protein